MRTILVLCSLLLAGCASRPTGETPNPWPLNGTVFQLGSGAAPNGFRARSQSFSDALRDQRLLIQHRNLFWGINSAKTLEEIREGW